MDDRTEQVTRALADMSERLAEYADVWRKAIERNATDAYRSDDFLVDLQTLWGMGVRDIARVGFAIADALAPSQAGGVSAQTAPRKPAAKKRPAKKRPVKKRM